MPKDFLKDFKSLAEAKEEYLDSRLEQIKVDLEQISKIDEDSNPFKSKIKSIKLIHPHAPGKMLSSIGFGDGKVRHRHHSR